MLENVIHLGRAVVCSVLCGLSLGRWAGELPYLSDPWGKKGQRASPTQKSHCSLRTAPLLGQQGWKSESMVLNPGSPLLKASEVLPHLGQAWQPPPHQGGNSEKLPLGICPSLLFFSMQAFLGVENTCFLPIIQSCGWGAHRDDFSSSLVTSAGSQCGRYIQVTGRRQMCLPLASLHPLAECRGYQGLEEGP